MDETNALDMLARAGESARRRSPRRTVKGEDFASQFMAMLFDDTSMRQNLRSPGTDRLSGSDPHSRAGVSRPDAGAVDPGDDSEEGRTDEPMVAGRRALLLPGSGGSPSGVKQPSPESVSTDGAHVPEEAPMPRPVGGEPDAGAAGDGARLGQHGLRGQDLANGASLRSMQESEEVGGKSGATGNDPRQVLLFREARTTEGTRGGSGFPGDPASGLRTVGEEARSRGTGAAEESGQLGGPREGTPAGREDGAREETVRGDRAGRLPSFSSRPDYDRDVAGRNALTDRLSPTVARRADQAVNRAAETEGRPAAESAPSRLPNAHSPHPPVLNGLAAAVAQAARNRPTQPQQTRTATPEAGKTQRERSLDSSQASHSRVASNSSTGMDPQAMPRHRVIRQDADRSVAHQNDEAAQEPSASDSGHRTVNRPEIESGRETRKESGPIRPGDASAKGHEGTAVREQIQPGLATVSGTALRTDPAGATPRIAAPHAPQPSIGTTDTGQIFDQIVETAKLDRVVGLDRFTVQLKPGFLGRIEIETEVSEDAAMRAVIRVEDPAVRKAVETGLAHLVSKLNELGLEIASARVAEFLPQNDSQGQQQPDGGASRSKSRQVTSRVDAPADAGEADTVLPVSDDGSVSYFV